MTEPNTPLPEKSEDSIVATLLETASFDDQTEAADEIEVKPPPVPGVKTP